MLCGTSGGLHARHDVRSGGQCTAAYQPRCWAHTRAGRDSVRCTAHPPESRQPAVEGGASDPSSSSNSSRRSNTPSSSQPSAAWQRMMDASGGSVCELGDWEGVTSRSVVHPGSSSEDIMRAEEYGNCRYECDADKGLIYGATVRFADSAALRLRRRAVVMWDEDIPRRVLIIKKPIPEAAEMLLEMAEWLQSKGVQVYVERAVHQGEFPQFLPFEPGTTQVDFGITLGGDGTVLYMSALFHEDSPLPPVLCFAMGTLGFLTPFDAREYKSHLSRVLAANSSPLFCTLRSRKRCELLDEGGSLIRELHVLNECVIDRGSFPGAVYMEIYIDGGFVTAAEADGLIIATPSGSTAYSMSAGGSMVAPSVPCTLITPLSPHSLSFRPLVVPESSDILVRLPPSARSHARASFDGKSPCRMPRGCSIRFTSSLCPLPTINIAQLDFDWFSGINYKLKWNQSIRAQPAATRVGAPLSAVLRTQGGPPGAATSSTRSAGGGPAAAGTAGAAAGAGVQMGPIYSYVDGSSNGTHAAAAGWVHDPAAHSSTGSNGSHASVTQPAHAALGQGPVGAASVDHGQHSSGSTSSMPHPTDGAHLAWGAAAAAAAVDGSGVGSAAGAAQEAMLPSPMTTDSSFEDMEFSMDGADDQWPAEAAGVQVPSMAPNPASNSPSQGNSTASSSSSNAAQARPSRSSADTWFVPRREGGAATPGNK